MHRLSHNTAWPMKEKCSIMKEIEDPPCDKIMDPTSEKSGVDVENNKSPFK